MKDQQFQKLVLFVNSLVPLAMLGWNAAHGELGANPKEAALHITGQMAVIFLLLSLVITPLRMITGRNWWSLFRKMLGLFAFFYACVHLSIYFAFYSDFDLRAFMAALISNKFIFFGLASVGLMLPLAITSTNGSIKRMGAAKWKTLHKLVYPAAMLAVAHFWMSKKADTTQPKIAAAILFVLLAYRLIKRKPATPKRVVAVTAPNAI